MPSTFFGLEIALRGLTAQSAAQDVVSNNIANANTPGYTKQVAQMTTTLPYPDPSANAAMIAGQLGTGVVVSQIDSARDQMLNNQITQGNSQQSSNSAVMTGLSQVESFFNEPTSPSIGDALNNFYSALSSVSSDPGDIGVRQNLIDTTQALTDQFSTMNTNLDNMDTQINGNIKTDVNSINSLASQINGVNYQIYKAQNMGYTTNDLLDTRQNLMNSLSKLTNFQATDMGNGYMKIEINGHTLVGQNYTVPLTTVTDPANNNAVNPVFSDDGAPLVTTGGDINGLITLRDTNIAGYRSSLDSMAQSLMTSVNSLQSSGYGLNDAAPTGINFFNGTDSADITINPAITADPTLIAAAASPSSPGDGSNALAMADTQNSLLMAGGTQTIGENYASLVSQVGSDSQSAQNNDQIYTSVSTNLQQQWQSESGVSLDEEMTNLVQYQHAFEANSKVMVVQDQMLQTLINMINPS
jgi:flagellar hook-associated protein 1 FlgK